jgi:hypothetical protein
MVTHRWWPPSGVLPSLTTETQRRAWLALTDDFQQVGVIAEHAGNLRPRRWDGARGARHTQPR